jgi:hypothetical protein
MPRKKIEKTHDWLTAKTIPRASNSEPAKKLTAKVLKDIREKEAATDKALDADTISMMKQKADQSAAWLLENGWNMIVGASPGYAPVWRKRNSKCDENPEAPPFLFSSDEASTTASEKASLGIYAHSASAVFHAEAGQWLLALRHAGLAGFHSGLSHARVRRSENAKHAGEKNGEMTEKAERIEAFAKFSQIKKEVGEDKFIKLTPRDLERDYSWFMMGQERRYRDGYHRKYLFEFKKKFKKSD